MAAEEDAGGVFPSALERVVRPLSSGVRKLVSSPDSGSVASDDGISARRRDGTTRRGKNRFNSTRHPSDEIIWTPEETIHVILRRNGGEMNQSEIVEMMEYSESTVSRKLSKMESEGAITRFQIGRGKVVFLPDAVPESFDSPLNRA